MRRLGLIGYPLGHSFSKGYFAEKFEKEGITDFAYENYPIAHIEDFLSLTEDESIEGLNVTIPYKEQIIPYLDVLYGAANEINAVNTVKIVRKAGDSLCLEGYNTDVYGFEKSLSPLLRAQHNKALILGTGGASKAIRYVLTNLGVDYVSASIEEQLHEKEIRYQDITPDTIAERLLIINATPLGTFPNVDTCPDIPYECLTPDHVLFDLVYNPSTTRFMSFGLERGANVKNGLEMLHLQAEKAWEIWNK